MDLLNISFGVVTVIAFIFSLYQHFSNKTKQTIEEAKVRAQHQRVRSATYAAIAAAEAADAIVQRSKLPSTTEDELRSLARVVRAQLMLLVRELQIEDENLSKWQFGRMIFSLPNPKKSSSMESSDDKGDTDDRSKAVSSSDGGAQGNQ